MRDHGATFGIVNGELRLDYGKAIDHSRKVADRLCKGVQGLLKKNRIELVAGRGRLAGPNTVEVRGASERTLEADHVLLATGSAEWTPPGLAVDGERVLTSREALESKRIPERLVVIGAGWIGSEVAASARGMGADVHLVEQAAVPLERVLGPEVGETIAIRPTGAPEGAAADLQGYVTKVNPVADAPISVVEVEGQGSDDDVVAQPDDHRSEY